MEAGGGRPWVGFCFGKFPGKDWLTNSFLDIRVLACIHLIFFFSLLSSSSALGIVVGTRDRQQTRQAMERRTSGV